jgi:HlyD family secretion protein
MRSLTLKTCRSVALLSLFTGGGLAPAADRGALELPGQVEAAEQTRLYARVAGFVGEVRAALGDRVKKGDVLAELAAPELEAELKQKAALVELARAEVERSKRAVQAAEAALEASKARLEEAKAGVDRVRKESDFRKAQLNRFQQLERDKAIDSQLLDEKRQLAGAAESAVSEGEARLKAAQSDEAVVAAKVEAARAEVKVNQARVEAAAADVQRTEALLQYTKVRAPFDGVVTRRGVDAGALVGPSAGGDAKSLFVVARVDAVRVVVDVPGKDAARLKPGAPAVVRPDALKGQEFKGKVTRTAGALDPEKQTLRVQIDLPNPDGKLMPGMSGTVVVTPDDETPPPGAPNGPKGDSGLLPPLPTGVLAPIMLPFDPTAAGVGVVVRGADVRSAIGSAPEQAQGAGPRVWTIIPWAPDKAKKSDPPINRIFWIDPGTGNQYFVGVTFPSSERR